MFTETMCLLKQAVAQTSSLSSEEHVLNRNLLNQVARGATTTPLTIKVILLGDVLGADWKDGRRLDVFSHSAFIASSI